MYLLEIVDVTKDYKINKDTTFHALENVSLTFNSNGLVTIFGKSGSGKSTLLNLIGNLDKPTSGNIFIKKININDKKIKKNYYNEYVSVVFQNYCLLDDKTVLENVLLPLQINGLKRNESEDIASKTLKYVGIDDSLFNKKCSLISGGEKQRVAIARSIVVNPKILLCDEPTGALDNQNSDKVMRLLKKISKERLVIVVSHNLLLSNKYSDRIIEINDGKILSDCNINYVKKINNESLTKIVRKNTWLNKFVIGNFKKRAGRNVISSLGFSIGLASLVLTIGFLNGKKATLENETKKHFDYDVGTISKEEKIQGGSFLSLTKSVRPDINYVNSVKEITNNFEICINYDAILPSFSEISIGDVFLDDVSFSPIYSFENGHCNDSLIIKGEMPLIDSKNEVIINQTAYDFIKDLINEDPINKTLTLSHSITTTYVDIDDTNVIDEININEELRIVGVCSELNYLSTNKIYYSLLAYDTYFDEYILPNISTYFSENITIKSRILSADNSSPLSSYSFRLFPSNIKNITQIDNLDLEKYGLSFSSTSKLIKNSLNGFFQVGEYGLEIFLIISIVGDVLILGIISFANYSDDHKKSAILSCFGASDSQIKSIYCYESIISGLLGIVFSIPLIILGKFLSNFIIAKTLHISNLISIPFFSFLGIKFFLPVCVLTLTLFICLISSIFPISLSKKVSLKEELQSL